MVDNFIILLSQRAAQTTDVCLFFSRRFFVGYIFSYLFFYILLADQYPISLLMHILIMQLMPCILKYCCIIFTICYFSYTHLQKVILPVPPFVYKCRLNLIIQRGSIFCNKWIRSTQPLVQIMEIDTLNYAYLKMLICKKRFV